MFLPVADAIGQGTTFWIFAVVCADALFFVSSSPARSPRPRTTP
ncbi:hypothetical protein ACFWZ2_31615 [Streptomyces sp. NPDC059002]